MRTKRPKQPTKCAKRPAKRGAKNLKRTTASAKRAPKPARRLVASGTRRIAALERKLDALATELAQALEQQAAAAEVLHIINASPGNLAPVFEAVLAKATRLCDFAFSILWSYDGTAFRAVAMHGVPPLYAEHLAGRAIVPPPNTEGAFSQFVAGKDFFHSDDVAATPLEQLTPRARGAVEFGDARTNMLVALRQDGRLLGAIEAYRTEVRPFAAKQVALLRGFAAQAVLAIENARLINETREALEQQTATADILRVISESPTDVGPVLQAVADAALRFCGASDAVVHLRDGDRVAIRAHAGIFGRPIDHPLSRESAGTRSIVDAATVHIPDMDALDPFEWAQARRFAAVHGHKAAVSAPMLRDGSAIGSVLLRKAQKGPFTPRQITLLEIFTAQAVIAIENVRLVTETRDALAQQTATTEVLQVINASPGDLAPVFDTMLESAMRLCEASFGLLQTYDGTRFSTVATRGLPPAFAEYRTRRPPDYAPGTGPARLLAGERVIHIHDLKDEAVYQHGDPNRRALVDLGGARTSLIVALTKDDAVRGFINIYRQDVRPFGDKQIALLQNFAAQAVIAMENARLLTELQARTSALTESLEYQTATGDVLKVMSRSAFDLEPVLQTVCDTARRLCDVDMAGIWRPEGDAFRWTVGRGEDEAYQTIQRNAPIRPGRGTLIGRVAVERDTVEIEDAWADPEYEEQHAARVGRARSLLGVPLLREDELIGIIGLARHRVEPFTRRHVELVETFADQAAIAIENARLLAETRAARDAAESALRDLTAAQANLIQAEKMASLGQLTAGIAHEIKNPLNFVNNFASLSNELLAELKELVAPVLASIGVGERTELDDMLALLSGNLAKITEHGKRADNIVKSMLAHSRGPGDNRQAIDLNALIEESLNLAYHGARAQDQLFNVTLERDFDQAAKSIALVPQDITRVFLNLFSNGFYAVVKRAKSEGGGFQPVVRVATRDRGDAVEVTVRDNGTGIPATIRDKLFEPFFTTKPPGEGTGLGLSISYDIVTKQHGGVITVDSKEGGFTEFTIRLPRGAASR